MKARVAIGIAIVLGLAAWFLFGGRKYPEVSSPQSLQLIKALYTACSSQNPQRLERVEQEIEATYVANGLTDRERAAFDSIIRRARKGDWESATHESFRFAEDQLR